MPEPSLSLSKFIPQVMLDVAWDVGPMLAFVDGGWRSSNPLLLASMGVDDWNRRIVAMQNYTLYHFMKRGPVIVNPDPDLAAALMDTEIRVPAAEYRQPYDIMGVVDAGRLVVVWRSPPMVNLWVMDGTGFTHYMVSGDDTPTIEDRLVDRQESQDAADYRVMVRGGRLALNACMLAAHREVSLTELPRLVRNHRMAQNRQLRRRACEQFQEIRFRDLIVRPRPDHDAMAGFGEPMRKQRRSGHWRRVPHGPQASLRRWTWIDEYETRPGEDWPEGQAPTTIVR